MKKRFLFLLIICFLLIFPVCNVNAANYICIGKGYHSKKSECDTNKKRYYTSEDYVSEIWNLKFTSDNKLVVDGFAFLDKVDNTSNKYRIVLEQRYGNGNVRTYVSESVDGYGGNGSRYLSKLYYYTSNCSGNLTEEAGTYDRLLNSHERSQKGDKVCGLRVNLCDYCNPKTYKNVQFKITVDLKGLTKNDRFDRNKNIRVKLLMSNHNKYYLKSIFVADGDYINNNDDLIDDVVTVKNNSLGKMLTATSYIRTSQSELMHSDGHGGGGNKEVKGKFKEGEEYKVIAIDSNYKPRLYKLGLKNSGKNGNTNTNCTGGADCFYKPGKGFYGYSFSLWMDFDGKTTFKLKPENPPPPTTPSPPSCDAKICLGGNCDSSYTTDLSSSSDRCPIINSPSVVDSLSSSVNIDKCNDIAGTASSSIKYSYASKVYLRVPRIINYPKKVWTDSSGNVTLVRNAKSYELCNSFVNDNSDNAYVFVPVTFNSKIESSERYSLIINESFRNVGTVNNGLGFPFGFSYSNSSINFQLASRVASNNANTSYTDTNNSYLGKSQISVKIGGNCVQKDVYFRLSSNDDIWYYDTSQRKWISKKYSQIYSYLFDTYQYEIINDNISDKVLNVDVRYPNSNSVKNGIYTHKNTFNLSKSSNNYNYSLPDAFIDNSGNIEYGKNPDDSKYRNIIDMEKELGLNKEGIKKYYIPFDWLDNKNFDFTVDGSTSNFSLIDNITIKVKFTCSVNNKNINDDFHDNVKYRTIDVSNPFPKKSQSNYNVPDNWNDYEDASSNDAFTKNVNRVKNTFKDGGVITYQTNQFRNNDRNSFYDLNRTYGNYSDWNLDMDDFTGNNKIIEKVSISDKKLFDSLYSGSHCVVGYFSSTCDKPNIR